LEFDLRNGPDQRISLDRVAEPQLRTVEVVPPSRTREGANVALIGFAILLAALFAILLRVEASSAGPGRADALPFQVSFQDLPSSEQRMFRALNEGFDEAKRLRGAEGKWPTPERLARDQIPPFAPDAIDRAGYRWTLLQDGLVLNYVGAPAQAGSPVLLLLIQEPESAGAEQPNPAIVDQEHVLLPDGKLLHVTYWKRLKPFAPTEVQFRPEVDGWTQVKLAAPKETR
jgi:hypothetical protein